MGQTQLSGLPAVWKIMSAVYLTSNFFFFFSPGSSLWEADVSRVGLNVVNAMSL